MGHNYGIYLMVNDVLYGFEDDKEAFDFDYAIRRYAEYSNSPYEVTSFRSDEILDGSGSVALENHIPNSYQDKKRLIAAGYTRNYNPSKPYKSPKGVERGFLEALLELDQHEKEQEKLLELYGKEFDLLMAGWTESVDFPGRWYPPQTLRGQLLGEDPYLLERALEIMRSQEEQPFGRTDVPILCSHRPSFR